MFLNSSFYCSYGDYQDIPDSLKIECLYFKIDIFVAYDVDKKAVTECEKEVKAL